jgi:hypothetical protein
MSWLIYIAIAYGVLLCAMLLVFRGKPFTFNYRGDRRPVRVPLFKFLMVAFLAAFVLVSVPVHVVCRFVGLRGFYNLRDKSYATQNPFKRKEYR